MRGRERADRQRAHEEALRWRPRAGALLEQRVERIVARDAAASFPDPDVGSTVPPSAFYVLQSACAAVEDSRAEHAAVIGRAVAETARVHAEYSEAFDRAMELEKRLDLVYDREDELREALPDRLQHRADEGWVTPAAAVSVNANALLLFGETALTKVVFDVLKAPEFATWGMAAATQTMLISGAHQLGGLVAEALGDGPSGRRVDARWWLWPGAVILVVAAYFLALVRAGRLVADQVAVAGTVDDVSKIESVGLFFALQLGFLAVSAVTGYRRHAPELTPLKKVRVRRMWLTRRVDRAWRTVAQITTVLSAHEALIEAAEVRRDALDGAERHRAGASLASYYSGVAADADPETAAALSSQDLMGLFAAFSRWLAPGGMGDDQGGDSP